MPSRDNTAMVRRTASPRFVGRGAELAVLRDAFERARTGPEPTLVTILGEAGVGKSRLVSEFVAGLPARVLVGACAMIGEDGPPYGPFLPALRALGSLPEADGGGPPGLVGSTARAWFFQATVDRLEIAARETPVVIVLEDFQWSDRASRDLLDFAVRCLPPSPVLVAITVRTDDLERGHPVASFLAELSRHERSERLELGGIDRDASAALLTGLLGDLPAREIQDIARRAGGNPYFLEELAAAARRDDRLPASIREFVEGRLADLPAGPAALVAAVAVADRACDEATLAEFTGLDRDQIAGLAAIAVERRLLESDGTRGAYRLRHGLIGEVVVRDTSPADRRRLHRAVARHLRLAAGRKDAARAAEIAYHLDQANDVEAGLPASIDAADAAERVFAYSDASRQWGRAIDQLDALAEPPDHLDPSWLLERSAIAAARAGEPEVAIEREQRLLGRLLRQGDRRLLAASWSRLSVWQWDAGHAVGVPESSARAVEQLPDLEVDATTASVLCAHARLLMLMSRYAEALPVAREAVAAAAAHAPDLEANARITLGATMTGLDEVDDGIAEIRAGLDLARTLGLPDEIARAVLNLDYAYWATGRLREALQVTLDGIDELRALGVQSAFGAMFIANAGEKLAELGEWDEARSRFEEVRLDQTEGVTGIDARTSAADLAIGQGRFGEARRLLDQAIARAAEVNTGAVAVRLQVVSAELAAWEGRPADGLAALDAAQAALIPDDRAVYAPRLAAIGLRLLADEAAVARAMRNREVLPGLIARSSAFMDLIPHSMLPPGQPADRGAAFALLATAERSRLRRLADDEAETSQHDPWLEAAAAFDDRGSPYPAAYARFRHAEALLSTRGDRSTASNELRSSYHTAVRLGAQPLLSEVRALATQARIALDPAADRSVPATPAADRPAGLTEREMDVLRLLTLGRTNREIAGALFITEKTAGLHVSNILAKLQVSNRVEAAAAAHRLGVDRSEEAVTPSA